MGEFRTYLVSTYQFADAQQRVLHVRSDRLGAVHPGARLRRVEPEQIPATHSHTGIKEHSVACFASPIRYSVRAKTRFKHIHLCSPPDYQRFS